MIHMSVDPRARPELLRGHNDELGPVINFACDIVWQSAISERNERTPFKDVNLGVFINAAGSGGGGSSAGHTAHNDDSVGLGRCFHLDSAVKQEAELQFEVLFQGIFASSNASPQKPVKPANSRPLPTPSGMMAKNLLIVRASNPPRAERKPTVICTWRMSGKTRLWPRFTGSPASIQAWVPPSTRTQPWTPAHSNFSMARRARPPDWQST